MSRIRVVCTMLVVAGLLLSGCQTMSSYWKSTKRFYGEYINPPAELDLDDVPSYEVEEARLANSFTDMDYQLFSLERAFESCPMPPSGEWITQILARFPWLSGIAAISNTGAILEQFPSSPIKPLDFSPLLETPEGRNRNALRSYVQETPFGPEVHLGLPIYGGNEFRGLLIAHFDFRSVLTYSTAPDDLIATTPDTLLWQGRYPVGNAVTATEWPPLLRSKYYGTVGKGAGSFYWVVRYFANLPMVFAVPVGDPGQMTVDPATQTFLSK